MTRYSTAFKDAIIGRILSPDSKSIRSVAAENDVPIGTVLSWLNKKEIPMKKYVDKLDKVDKGIEESLQTRFEIILESASMSDEELSAYCRQKGIYPEDIEIWKQEMMSNLDSRNKKVLDEENNSLRIRVRELQAELKCKDKALAEASALLLLKKKAKIIWADQGEEK